MTEPPTRLEFLNDTGAVIACHVSGTPTPRVQWLLAADVFSAFNLDNGISRNRSPSVNLPAASHSKLSIYSPPVTLHRFLEQLPDLRYTRTDGSLVFSPFSAPQYTAEVHSTAYVCIAWNQHGAIISRQVNVRAGTGLLGLVSLMDFHSINEFS